MGLKAKYYENKVMFVDKCVKFGKKKKTCYKNAFVCCQH